MSSQLIYSKAYSFLYFVNKFIKLIIIIVISFKKKTCWSSRKCKKNLTTNCLLLFKQKDETMLKLCVKEKETNISEFNYVNQYNP